MKSFERRRAPRVPVQVPVQQHAGGETHHGVTSNLSLSGLYMERPIADFVRQRAAVELVIPLPDGAAPLRAEGEIVYDCFDAGNHGTAVRFTRMSGEDRGRLSAFLAS